MVKTVYHIKGVGKDSANKKLVNVDFKVVVDDLSKLKTAVEDAHKLLYGDQVELLNYTATLSAL